MKNKELVNTLKTKRKTSSSSTITEIQERNKKPPAGAKIIEQTVRTETEEIENGWLVTKTTSGRYKEKGAAEDSYGNYFDFSQKWYSKEDPLEINVKDKSLASVFDENPMN